MIGSEVCFRIHDILIFQLNTFRKLLQVQSHTAARKYCELRAKINYEFLPFLLHANGTSSDLSFKILKMGDLQILTSDEIMLLR